MENKVEALKQQNQDIKGEVSQLKEQMTQMFQILSQTNVAITAMANQGAMGYAQPGCVNEPPPRGAKDLPYGMSYRWRTEAPTIEEHEQQNVVNNKGAKAREPNRVTKTAPRDRMMLGLNPRHRKLHNLS
ncbi:hypothetical protein CR513_49921, partial [Mucuna pruriens]